MNQSPEKIQIIDASHFRKLQGSPDCFVVDVRDEGEFATACESGSCNWPLASLTQDRVTALLGQHGVTPQQTLVLLCARGMRARQAAEKLQQWVPNPIAVVDGGRAALAPAGAPWSIERQVRVAAGSLVLVGVLGSWLIHPALLAISAFVGAGLVFAGVTDWCGMGMLLMKMPWNQPPNT